MRLDNTISYPRQMTLGALTDKQLICDMGCELARQLNLLGVYINFAPVMDVNTNPHNSVIGTRFFGEGKGTAAAKGVAYIKGQGILAVAKHSYPNTHNTTFTKESIRTQVQDALYKAMQDAVTDSMDT